MRVKQQVNTNESEREMTASDTFLATQRNESRKTRPREEETTKGEYVKEEQAWREKARSRAGGSDEREAKKGPL